MISASTRAVVLGLTMLGSCFAAEEPDILDLVQKNPLHIETAAGKPKYGDPDLDEAVEALAKVPRPWTVPKIIHFVETSPWMQTYGEYQVVGRMSPTWRGDEAYLAHLMTLLAASRDPRAAMILIKAMDYRSTKIKSTARWGLYCYFVPDARYHRLPHDPKDDKTMFYTDFIPEMTREVRAWWGTERKGHHGGRRGIEIGGSRTVTGLAGGARHWTFCLRASGDNT